MQVHYLGPEGTFSHTAALQVCGWLGWTDVQLVSQPTLPQVIGHTAASMDGEAYGCVPLENSVEGSVVSSWDNLGRLARQAEESQGPRADEGVLAAPGILCSFTLRIEQRLLTLPASDPGLLEEVVSHPQSLAQCQEWLERHLPRARRVPVASNAEAARVVREAQDVRRGAIGPESAGIAYGLTASGPIQDSADNRTRFGLIGRRPLPASALHNEGPWTLALVVYGVPNRPGGLLETLQPFHRSGFNLSRIESRPVGKRLGEYVYYLDVEWPFGNRTPDDISAWRDVIGEFGRHGIHALPLGLFPALVEGPAGGAVKP